MLKKIISSTIIMLFLFVSFAGVFASGHKGSNGEFIEEENITQEYVAGVEGVEAVDEVIGYTINYSITPNQTAIDNSWIYDVKFNDKEVTENTESDPFENEIPDIYVEATRTSPSYTIHVAKNDLVEGNNVIVLDESTNQADNEFNGGASFTVNVKVTKVTITEAVEGVEAVDEIVGVKEIYITGYKITSGKYAGYSVMFAEKVLKCTIQFKIVDGKEEIIKTEDTKDWHKLKCMKFGIYVKKSCKWHSGYLFKYNKWQHKGKYVKIKKEEVVTVNNDSSKEENTYNSTSNYDYSYNSGSNESSDLSESSNTSNSSKDDKTVYSGGLPKTGEDSTLDYVFFAIGALIVFVGGGILLRKKVINKYMK
jgi:LPXTG-motif cell wall-anchored protein